ncbi:protein PAXX [Salarias fasciatus]|uniref:PAXX non-homologous end joining factor n=1 Tax=Salarias fasciatus TaxID=181472 RepID=A0A672HP75_SALFA|nr:protein PAXX [Salarias fasciatus]
MDTSRSFYCTVLDKQSKFICYTRLKDGTFRICLTDAADVWSSDSSEDSLQHLRRTFSLKSTEESIMRLRSSCSSGDVSVLVQDSGAELVVGSDPGAPRVTLSRLEGPRAAEELKELLFEMADRLTRVQDETSAASPPKNQLRRPADFNPRQQNGSPSSSLPVKRRLPGACLINPGAKKKLQATGVAFDDADED